MLIESSTLEAIEKDRKSFVDFFSEYALSTMHEARLSPCLSYPRLEDAHGAWVHDLGRVGNHEKHIEEGLDHFKRAGHLAFWLRRFAPVVEARDDQNNLGDAPGYDLTNQEKAFRDILYGYANEYLAFDLAYQFCRFYESQRENGPNLSAFKIDRDYIITVCNFLKYKSVSPHALTVILKSLFFGR